MAPDDVIDAIAHVQTHIEPGHAVFWPDFGGLPPALVLRSMRLITQEVLPQFAVEAP